VTPTTDETLTSAASPPLTMIPVIRRLSGRLWPGCALFAAAGHLGRAVRLVPDSHRTLHPISAPTGTGDRRTRPPTTTMKVTMPADDTDPLTEHLTVGGHHARRRPR
jgi:hypothetical protein